MNPISGTKLPTRSVEGFFNWMRAKFTLLSRQVKRIMRAKRARIFSTSILLLTITLQVDLRLQIKGQGQNK